MPGFMPGSHAFIHAEHIKTWMAGTSPAMTWDGQMPSFMDLALDEARAAQAAGEVPVGCVIVRDGAVSPWPATARSPTAIRPRMPKCWRSAPRPPRSAPSG